MNIPQLYAQNGNLAGFWVQHRTWRNQCAQVQTVGGRRSGPLPHKHSLPIVMQVFDVRSGRAVEPCDLGAPELDRNFIRIADPPWCRQRQ
jgi:hypothetical protein